MYRSIKTPQLIEFFTSVKNKTNRLDQELLKTRLNQEFNDLGEEFFHEHIWHTIKKIFKNFNQGIEMKDYMDFVRTFLNAGAD
jgi:hypothetical protein